MEGLISLLLAAGIFYLMMRFGCGMHTVHGHGRDSEHSSKKDNQHVDPVCGMEVQTNVGYGKMHEGRLYRFCSRNCLDRFEAKPEEYTSHIQDDQGGTS